MTTAAPATAPTTELTVQDPRDGSTVGTLAAATEEEVRAAVATARGAARDWARTAPEERGKALRAAADRLAAHAEELAELNARETGKPVEESLGGVMAGVGTLHQYAELGPVHRGHSLRGSVLAADYTVAEPRGVVVALTPWNDPVAVAAGLLGAAIVTGNTVVHKPSERCPHVGARLGEILAGALPAGVLGTVTGGAAVGQLLTALPGVDVLAHVGSTATGEAIARAALGTGAHVVRENGGNDALVVDDDVDPVWAAGQAALGAFANSGQICVAVERIYVHRGVAEPFLEALAEEARRRNTDGTLAPLVDERLREEVHRQVAESVAQGAVVLEGAQVPEGPGAFYPATVLRGCTPAMTVMTVMTEETFGPVAPVQVVDSFDEGLRLAAADRYGLAATVLTGRIAHAQRAVAELPVGTLKVNNVFGGAPGGAAQPRRASGAGFGYGPELLDEMTQVKVVHLEMPPAAG
ncbi:aldehyde dehydrogenase family protein [Kocuria rosea]|uniref:aldehyde dehydrogenase family protein n=1 Tax=Kocuria rosea TaxID=1275 RepID=UPI000D6421AE|nr:aldehyde dehydrogenase family protein [Kocuria rosea]PWF84705.1 aldehyde dehydrogenase [Kocuria rosea]STX01911.1 Succinate-semialdehyde dehydrogenase [NADP(+)] [Kocuria rosea]